MGLKSKNRTALAARSKSELARTVQTEKKKQGSDANEVTHFASSRSTLILLPFEIPC